MQNVILRFQWCRKNKAVLGSCIKTGNITLILHYSDVIMGTMASQIISLTIVYSTVYFGSDQRKRQSSASLVFVQGIHRWPVNSPHKWPVTRKTFPFDDVIMIYWYGRTRLILYARLMMSWLLASPGHHQPWYWLWSIIILKGRFQQTLLFQCWKLLKNTITFLCSLQ